MVCAGNTGEALRRIPPGSRRLLKVVLEAEGIAVVGEAGDARAGVDRVRDRDPEVVLMNLRLPDMSGIEATRLIKESSPLTQVIILTAHDGPLPRESAEQVGVYAYMVTGVAAELLRDVILDAWAYGEGLRALGSPGRKPVRIT